MPLVMDGTDQRVARLEGLVASLEARVRALEQPAASLPSPAPAVPAPMAFTAPTAASVDPAGLLALLGRTFVVLAGAYLLRAAVDAGAVPGAVGVWIGMAYAGVWLVQSDRNGSAARHLSALFHGGAAVLIAMPVLAEATTRFMVITPAGAALVLVVVTALALLVASRIRSEGLAWLATVAAVVTAAVLALRTGATAGFSVSLIGIGIETLWLGYERDWFGPRWLAAAVADLAVVGLTMRALTPATGERPAAAMAIQFLLLAAYLTTVTVRTLVRGRDVIPFEVVQTGAALAVGLGGAVAIARATGAGDALLGWATAACACGCYVVALLDRQRTRPANFVFYGTLGLILLMVGSAVALPDRPTAWLWLVLAVACAWTGPAFARPMLIVHATVYSVGVALLTGAAGAAVTTLLPPAAAPLPPLSPELLAVAAGIALCVAGQVPRRNRVEALALDVCRVLWAVALMSLVGAIAVLLIAGALGPPSSPSLDAGVLATVRTTVLAALALLLAAAGRSGRLREFGWLLYPVLAGIALKLVIEDIAQSTPAMLVVALTAYGGALILAPRVARRTSPPTAKAEPGHRPSSPRS